MLSNLCFVSVFNNVLKDICKKSSLHSIHKAALQRKQAIRGGRGQGQSWEIRVATMQHFFISHLKTLETFLSKL